MNLLNAFDIKKLVAEQNIIDPFIDFQPDCHKKISYGLSHAGYDIRCDNKFMYIEEI